MKKREYVKSYVEFNRFSLCAITECLARISCFLCINIMESLFFSCETDGDDDDEKKTSNQKPETKEMLSWEDPPLRQATCQFWITRKHVANISRLFISFAIKKEAKRRRRRSREKKKKTNEAEERLVIEKNEWMSAKSSWNGKWIAEELWFGRKMSKQRFNAHLCMHLTNEMRCKHIVHDYPERPLFSFFFSSLHYHHLLSFILLPLQKFIKNRW